MQDYFPSSITHNNGEGTPGVCGGLGGVGGHLTYRKAGQSRALSGYTGFGAAGGGGGVGCFPDSDWDYDYGNLRVDGGTGAPGGVVVEALRPLAADHTTILLSNQTAGRTPTVTIQALTAAADNIWGTGGGLQVSATSRSDLALTSPTGTPEPGLQGYRWVKPAGAYTLAFQTGLVALTPWAREERDAAYRGGADSDLEKARRFAVECWMTFGVFPRESNGWRLSIGKEQDGGPDNPKLWGRLPKCIGQAAERLLEVQIENRPALEVIQRFNGPQVLIYADPPYVRQTRTANGDAYTHEMIDVDHVALLQALNEHKGPVFLSGYDCELYQDMLSDWHCERINTTAERGARRTQCLWSKGVPIKARHKQLSLF